MSDNNPYDFLSSDVPLNGTSPKHSDNTNPDESAPEATIPRADSVTALAAREAYESLSEATEETGSQSSLELAMVPELAPLDDLPADSAVELQTAPSSAVETVTTSYDPERAVLQEPIDPNAPKDVELGLFEHLGELRMRMLRAITFIMLASVVTWNQTQRIQGILLRPVLATLKSHGITQGPVLNDPMEGFVTYFQMALVSALIVSAPFVIWEMWRFIEPALTRTEKRYSSLLLPFSIILFVTGCTLGYLMSPVFFNFFLAFVPPGVTVLWTYSSVVLLLGKMLLVFGVCFQVPVVTIFLNKTGIVSRNILIEYWRHVVVVIFTVVAIITPTWDPFTLVVCSLPPCVLYALSIWLIKWL